jgi:hypothetical protein
MVYTLKTSDEAVKKASGKTWVQWFALLDKAGAKKMTHTDIVKWVFKNHLGKKGANTNVATSGGWWSQMVTVEYERSRGLRKVNQNTMGFMVAVHKTVGMSLPQFKTKWRQVLAAPGVKARKLSALPTKAKHRLFYYQMAHGKLIVGSGTAPSGKLRIVVEAVGLSGPGAVTRERNFWRTQLDSIEKGGN